MSAQILRRAAAACALLLLLTAFAYAQSDNSTISGIVKDQTGAAVPGAQVTVTNESTGFERQVTSNERGFYTVTNIPPGYYSIKVGLAGFKTTTSTRNKLEAAVPLAVNIDLTVGELAEVVNVEATAAQMNTESATVGKTVEETQIQNMALNGRNPLFLALLKPGVRRGSVAGFSYGLDSAGLTINGGRSQDSLITFDGAVGIRTRANGTSIGTADVDTIQEVQILTANYSAEYGRSAAGQVRMVTKSGGKDFHGTLFEYLRNDALDANSWSRNRNQATNFVSPFRYNQFGYNINGPVMIPGVFNASREKLFFLWSQEWVRRRAEETQFQRVPSLKMRNGDFSELLGSNIFYSGTRTITDPLTGQPFDGNIIPASRLSPNGIAFLRTYPEPNGLYQGNNNFTKTRPNWQNQRKDMIAIDFNPAPTHFIKFRHANYAYTALDTFRTGFDYAITDWYAPEQDRQPRPHLDAQPDDDQRSSSSRLRWTACSSASTARASATCARAPASTTRTSSPSARRSTTRSRPSRSPTWARSTAGRIRRAPTGPIYQVSNNFTKIGATTRSRWASCGSVPARTTSTRSTSPAFRAAPTTRTAASSSPTPVRRRGSRHRPGQCRTGPLLDLRRDRPARLHALPQPHVRVLRTGFLARQPPS